MHFRGALLFGWLILGNIIHVDAATTPYSGTPVSIPGTIQAEDFDNGGEGVAYHDTTAGNAGGQYRTTNVDIQAASSGGYHVGWTAPGEWLHYTVNVTAAGSYTVQLRVASPSGASLHVGFNTASNVWKSVPVPATGGWQNWTTVTVPVTLAAGRQQLTVQADTGGFNFDSMNVTSAAGAATGTVSVTLTSPANASNYTAAATITLGAKASTTSGTVSKVEFFSGATLIGTATRAPYGGTWSSVAAGTYALSARATNSAGATATSATATVIVGSATPTPLPSSGLVEPGNLVYQGSFRTPGILTPGTDRGFDYGGTSPAFNAAHNSLLLFSHPYDWNTAELGIPTPGTGSVSSLPTAPALHGFVDPFGGHRKDVADPTASVGAGGQLLYQGQLYLTAYMGYGGGQTLSHFVRPLDLNASGPVAGPFRVGPLGANFYSGYMTEVPPEWQATFGPTLTGQCCLSVISRTSYGPAVFAFDLGRLGTAQNATPLVYYPSDHKTLGDWNMTSQYFNGTSEISGLVFPAGTSSVLFLGRQGIGTYCYGEGAACGDQEGTAKGDHAYPYIYYVWAYNAHDLAAVKAGTKQPWDVVPYAVWPLNLPYEPNHNGHHLGGATYDPATKRLFVSQMFANGDEPVIHIFKVQ